MGNAFIGSVLMLEKSQIYMCLRPLLVLVFNNVFVVWLGMFSHKMSKITNFGHKGPSINYVAKMSLL